MKYEISQELANELLNYLATRPYRESAPLIDKLSKLEPIKEEEPEK